ncbi:MAG: DNA/RNA non-specific endonuclease, partial [Pirellulales bacterium]|nr:DNA/RNA non-specific endonuclease [Pirellulales bacterium]
MPYDPEFITGHEVALPKLLPSLQSVAFNGGNSIGHTRFSVVFHQRRGFAIYTAHNIDGETIIDEEVIPRRDRFRFDPHVARHLQVDNDRGYRGEHNLWDRGHLVRRRSLHWGPQGEAEEADSESYFWTNIAPQHSRLHDTAWGMIEDWIFEATDRSDSSACVFTGPVYTEADPERINAPGELPIRIPAGYWKIIAIVHRQQMTAAGFLVWQRDYDRDEPLEFDPILEQVRVTTLEFLTGLSFLSLRQADLLRFGAQLDL